MRTPLFLLILLVAAFSNCQKSDPNPSPQTVVTYDEVVAAANREGIPLSAFGIKRDWNGVLAIAKIYELEEIFRGQERINNSLERMTEENLHAFFKEQKRARETMRQVKAYMEKGQHIQSLSDYFSLLDSLPLYRIKRYPTDEKYAAIKKEYFASNYQFFINEAVMSGGPNHIPPFLIVLTRPEQMPTDKARRIAKR